VKVSLHQTPTHTRREFCASACRGASLLAAGVLWGCGGNPNSPSGGTPLSTVSGSVSGRAVSVSIDSASPLAASGSAAMLQSSLGTFLIARTGQETFNVLTAVCTHEACTITGFSGSQFVCPCHGSEFTTSGAVARGPAARSLQSFPSQFANGVLTFTA
jgi:nitrite reductase/ring-hydroxylating ferredoxin subunit